MATPKEQLLSRTVYDTDGTTTIWDFAFSGGYLDPSHVKAYTETPLGLRTQLVLPAGSLIGQFQLRILPALAAGNELVIYRDTPKNLPLVDFTDESGFSEIALDTNAKQGVFIAAEAIDTVNALDVAAAIDAADAAGAAALAAQASQAAASSAANSAAISQSAANSSASAALAAQLAAESARNVAATEAAAAAVSATSADTSRTQAQASATAAQASATAAQASATAAADSQTAAATSATAAASSATAAGSSASAANTSATASAASAALSQAQAVAAQDSAASAAASAASVNPANLVQVTGDQTIGGVKTFTGNVTAPAFIGDGSQLTGINAVPAGAVMHFAMNSAPTGWLRANGATVSRATFAALFAAIGTTYGAGDGSTTFRLPDLRGEFLRGWDDGRGVDSGRVFGSAQTDAMQGHHHDAWLQGLNAAGGPTNMVGAVGQGTAAGTAVQSPRTDGVNGTPRTSSETRPRNVALLACIKF